MTSADTKKEERRVIRAAMRLARQKLAYEGPYEYTGSEATRLQLLAKHYTGEIAELLNACAALAKRSKR